MAENVVSAGDVQRVVSSSSATSSLRQSEHLQSLYFTVTHDRLKRTFVLRFDLHDTVLDVKGDLQQRTGTAADAMRLQLFDREDCMLAADLDDTKRLGYYSPAEGCRLHIIDTNPSSLAAGGWLDDTSLVPKFEISEEKYNQLPDTARRFKERIVELRPDLLPRKEADPDYMADEAAEIKVGSRCQVQPGERRGEVKYVGPVAELFPGFWVGVRLDEPSGKNDGSVGGVEYFKCPPGFGVFVRPDKVEVGDFPERDPFADEPDEI